MLFRYFLLALIVVAIGACSDKVSENTYPNDESASCINDASSCTGIIIGNPNDYSGVDPQDVDPSTLAPNVTLESFAKGSVVDFSWQNTLPWYYAAENYPYGFDKDPMSNWLEHVETSKDVYVSVADDEMARVVLKVPSEFEVALLSLVDENGTTVCVGGVCKGEITLDAGDYTLKYNGVDQERNLHVISYKKREQCTAKNHKCG